MEAAAVLFLDTLLDDENVDAALLHRTVDDSVENAEVAAASVVRQHHSRPSLYSEQWVSCYIDEDFKANFRLSREQFNDLLTNVVAKELMQVKSWSINPQKATEITLWYLATQVSFTVAYIELFCTENSIGHKLLPVLQRSYRF